MSKAPNWELLTSSALVGIALSVSGFAPYDRLTWVLEVAPVFIVYPILWATHRRFRFTSLLYWLIALHAVVLTVGGAFTYARVPVGAWTAGLFGLHRNPYDKLGHFFQGFVPALAAREILIRGDHVRGKKMLALLIVCIGLAISAVYELVEWGTAMVLGQGADDFLGTQGDPWDTQSDMFCAFIGAIAALVALSKHHDEHLGKSKPPFLKSDRDLKP